MIPEEIYRLIGKELKGESSAEEAQLIADWRQGEQNEKTYQEMVSLWDHYKSLGKISPAYDAAQAWEAIEKELDQPTASKSTSRWALKVAASISLLALVGALLYWELRPSNLQLEATADAVSTITLDDGSRIWLNKNSQLTYPKHFGADTRLVHLHGEAYFEVSPDAARPFIIESDHESQIRVVGTAFNYLTLPDSSVVSVVEGIVQMESDDHPSILVNASEKGVSRPAGLSKRLFKEPNLLSWKTGRLLFENTSLPLVIRDLERHYSIAIQLEGNTEHCAFSSTYTQASLETILDELALILNLEWRMERESNYVVSGNGCN